MTKDRRNNFIVTLTILIVAIGSGATFLIIKTNEPPKKPVGHQLVFAADSGKNALIGVDKFVKLRNYTEFELGTDSALNIRTLEQARQKLNSIKDNHDTINGVHIILADNTPYKYFIKSVDICMDKRPRAFAPHNNDIYAWYLDMTPRDNSGDDKLDK